MRTRFVHRNNDPRRSFFLWAKHRFGLAIFRFGRNETAFLVHFRRRDRYFPFFPYDRYLAWPVLFSVNAGARHCREVRLAFLDQRGAVLHTKTQDLFVVAGPTRRAIFHNGSVWGMSSLPESSAQYISTHLDAGNSVAAQKKGHRRAGGPLFLQVGSD